MTVNPLLHQQNKLYYLLALLVLAAIQAFGVTYFFGFPFALAADDAVISWLLIGVIVFFILNTFSFFRPSRFRWLAALGAAVIFSFLWYQLSAWIIINVTHSNDITWFVKTTSFYRLTVAFLLFLGAVFFGLVWYRLGEKEEEQRRNEETEKMAREAELFKLRQQLQPHFLFNSLNSINSLIGSRPQEARKMVQQLSDFLRGTMRREDQKFVSLKEEMEYLKLYLDIEQVRFGHRLKVNMDCAEESLNWKIPPLILQPILENAIKFGLYGTVENLLISLKCAQGENHLLITVQNPFDPDVQLSSGTGFGLKSVKRRLFLLFARTDLLEIDSIENQFIVNLKIPRFHDQGSDN